MTCQASVHRGGGWVRRLRRRAERGKHGFLRALMDTSNLHPWGEGGARCNHRQPQQLQQQQRRQQQHDCGGRAAFASIKANSCAAVDRAGGPHPRAPPQGGHPNAFPRRRRPPTPPPSPLALHFAPSTPHPHAPLMYTPYHCLDQQSPHLPPGGVVTERGLPRQVEERDPHRHGHALVVRRHRRIGPASLRVVPAPAGGGGGGRQRQLVRQGPLRYSLPAACTMLPDLNSNTILLHSQQRGGEP